VFLFLARALCFSSVLPTVRPLRNSRPRAIERRCATAARLCGNLPCRLSLTRLGRLEYAVILARTTRARLTAKLTAEAVNISGRERTDSQSVSVKMLVITHFADAGGLLSYDS
jgi:hypothetical protein